jgi:predicted amidohydrolase YtcJ
LTVTEALRAVTIDAAWQLFMDDRVGSLTVGKYADLVMLDASPLRVEPGKIGDLSVLATWLAGREVFRQDA